MLRAVIVEDEPLARRYLRTLLEATGEVTVAGEAADGRTGLRLIETTRPDAVFLDIRMPGEDGVALAERLRALTAPIPLVVFVTGHADRTLDAFRVEAVDYLLKPIEAASVARIVDRLQRRLPVRAEPNGDVLRLLAPADIVAALRRERRTFLHTATHEFPTYYPIGALNQWLNGLSGRGLAPPFVLVARDALVNLHAVSDIIHYGDRLYQVRLRDRENTVVQASRGGAVRLAARLRPPV